MSTVQVNKHGYLLHFHSPEGRRSYGCEDLPSLQHLIKMLTGRDWDSFLPDDTGLPRLDQTHNECSFSIGYPFHIYREV